MSRCFPFPPPGYAGKCSSNEALIDSIKLQRERENAISSRELQKVKSLDKKRDKSSDRKKDKSSDKKKEDRKKEKKEKKERKDKKRVQTAIDGVKHKHIDNLGDCKGKQTLPKQEVLEQSNLTEEHDRPVESQNVPCSSDSTGNSGKRKRHSSPTSSIQGNGNVIRIRLSSQKRDEPSTSASIPSLKSEDHSPTLARTDSFISQKHEMLKVQEPILPALTRSTASLQLSGQDKDPRTHQERVNASLPRREVPTTSGKTEARKPSKKLSHHEKKMLKRESLYTNLFENLVPPTLHNDLVVDQDEDEEWLFGKKDAERPAKRVRGSDDPCSLLDNLPCSASAIQQQRAHYLSDVEVYALPFTVPF